MKVSHFSSAAAGFLVLATSINAAAVTLVVDTGRLTGAKDVAVNGTLYDVDFLDGTCVELFNGCDGEEDLVFVGRESALEASQALLDQVFLDSTLGMFDSEAALTNGCMEYFTNECLALTPFGFQPDRVLIAAAINADVNAQQLLP